MYVFDDKRYAAFPGGRCDITLRTVYLTVHLTAHLTVHMSDHLTAHLTVHLTDHQTDRRLAAHDLDVSGQMAIYSSRC